MNMNEIYADKCQSPLLYGDKRRKSRGAQEPVFKTDDDSLDDDDRIDQWAERIERKGNAVYSFAQLDYEMMFDETSGYYADCAHMDAIEARNG